jgi:HSP90 family molecular chaperone
LYPESIKNAEESYKDKAISEEELIMQAQDAIKKLKSQKIEENDIIAPSKH